MGTTLYCVTNRVNGKLYVGITAKTVDQRWRQHVWDAGRNSRCPFHLAIAKHGTANFDAISLFDYASRLDAEAAEIALIAALDLRRLGYNAAAGGSAPMVGVQHTAGTKIKISNTMSGREFSSAHRAALSRSAKGKPRSEAQMQVVRDRVARGVSEETRAKIGAASRGHITSEETKRKLSIASKRWWAEAHGA